MTRPTDKEILHSASLFHSRAEALKDEDFLRSLHLGIKTHQQKNGTAIYTNFDGPDRKTIESFLMRFRPFILQGETINFLATCNRLAFFLKDKDPALLKKVANAKEAWNKVLVSSDGMSFNVNNETIQSKEIFDLWLNGEFFHPTDKDDQKYKKLELAKIPPFEQMLFMEFITHVQKHAELILWLDTHIVQKILNISK